MSKDFELLNSYERSDSFCSPSPQSKLLSAFEERSIDKFVEVLKNGVRSRRVDVNHFYEDPLFGTLLDVACESKNTGAFVDALIQYGADVNVVNGQRKKAPIHVAVENSDADTVKVLVQNKSININIKDSYGNTALHLAAKLNKVDIIKILFEHPALDINASNRKGQIPLHLALAQGCKESVRILLTRFDIDLDEQKNFAGQSCREIIKEKYPELVMELPEMKRGGVTNTNLFTLLHKRDTKSFVKLAKINRNSLEENDGRCTYLQYACENGLADVVDTLLDLGADPNAHCPTNTDSPVLIAAHQGYYEILEKLLRKGCTLDPLDEKNVFTVLFNAMGTSADVSEEDRDHYRCLIQLLKEVPKGRVDINYPDSIGNTILYHAVRLNDDKIVKAVLEAGAYVGPINSFGKHPLQLMNAEVLEEYLDSCITTNGKLSRDAGYEIIYDYSMLVPPKRAIALAKQQNMESGRPDVYEVVSETDPLLTMSNLQDLRHLLKHPVLTSFLNLKWYTIRKYFYINLAFYLTFWLALTSYILYIYGSKDSKNMAGNATESINHFNAPENASLLWCFTFLLCGVLCVRELFQFSVSPWSYVKSPENWLEVSLIVITGAVLTCQTSLDSQPQLAALAILASWMELILLIGRHPLLSTNIEMFKTVTFNFLKFLAWYSILILAFAFSFYILFKDGSGDGSSFFRDPAMSVFKSVIMLTGEFDASGIPFGSELSTSHLLFVLFIFLVAIVLFNLLNGLAVSDTQAIRADAEIVGNVSRAKLISYIESMAIGDPFPCLNFFDKLKCACCCVPIQQSTRKRQKHIKMFYKRITLFPYTFPEGKARILPNDHNAVLLNESFETNKTDDSCYERISAWKMDNLIVKASQKILNKRMCRNDVANFGEMIKQYGQQLEEYKSKLQTVESTSERNEKMLMEIMSILKQRL